jgi:hypothetical protein
VNYLTKDDKFFFKKEYPAFASIDAYDPLLKIIQLIQKHDAANKGKSEVLRIIHSQRIVNNLQDALTSHKGYILVVNTL